jgi:hypothetical protein
MTRAFGIKRLEDKESYLALPMKAIMISLDISTYRQLLYCVMVLKQ